MKKILNILSLLILPLALILQRAMLKACEINKKIDKDKRKYK